MSKSWGHTIRPLTEEEIQKQIKDGELWYQYRVDNPLEGFLPDKDKFVAKERKCRISSKCCNKSTHILRYKYVTGKAGRVSWAEKQVCAVHAEKYLTPIPQFNNKSKIGKYDNQRR